MRVLLHPDRVGEDHELLDLTVHDTGGATTGAPPADGSTALDRGDRVATVLAFVVAGTLAIAAILALWATFPPDGGSDESRPGQEDQR